MAFLKGCTSGYRNDLNVIEGELQAIKQDVYKFKLYLNTAWVWQSNSSVMRQLPRCAEVWIWGRWTFHSVLLFLICQQQSWARQRIGAQVKNLFWLRISSRLQNSIKTVCLSTRQFNSSTYSVTHCATMTSKSWQWRFGTRTTCKYFYCTFSLPAVQLIIQL